MIDAQADVICQQCKKLGVLVDARTVTASGAVLWRAMECWHPVLFMGRIPEPVAWDICTLGGEE